MTGIMSENPILRLPYGESELVLHYGNTRIRTFKDGQFNHLEYIDEDNSLKGIQVAGAIVDLLVEHDFPSQFDPITDDSTMEWFVQLEMAILDGEIEL